MYIFDTFIKKYMVARVCLFWHLLFFWRGADLAFMSVFVPIPCCFANIALQYSLKLGILVLLILVFWLSIVWTIGEYLGYATGILRELSSLCRTLLKIRHFLSINSAISWTWEVFLTLIVFILFLYCLNILIVEVFNYFG